LARGAHVSVADGVITKGWNTMSKSASIIALAAIVVVCLAVRVGPAAAADKNELSSDDSKFVRNAAAAGVTEVELGKVAADRGANDEVKKLGQKTVDDHTKINAELKTLAQEHQLDLAKALGDAAKKSKREAEDLSNRRGADFDKAYLNMVVRDREEAVKAYGKASTKAEDSEVKAFAAKTLVTLQEHLDGAKALRGKLAK
jgi:putative membrane protein